MSFEVFSPAALNEALNKLDKYGKEIQPVAGGTNLLVDIKQRKTRPRKVLDLSKLDELKQIKQEGSKITIGALVTHNQLQNSPVLNHEAVTMLSQAAGMVGGPAIRNRGTVAGNIQSASPAADTVVPLLALDAKLTLASKSKIREVTLKDFLLGPGKTDRKPDELITQISFENLKKGSSVFYKLGKRNALAISIVSLGTYVELTSQGEIANVKIALGAVSSTAVRAGTVENYLVGKELTAEVINTAKTILLEDISPIDDLRASAKYRSKASQELLDRALRKAAVRGRAS